MPWVRSPIALGSRFGSLTVIAEVYSPPNSQRRVSCSCDCGTVKEFFWHNVRRGLSTNCGCIRRLHAGDASRTHGKSKTPEHRTWSSMWTRCTNPKCSQFRNYGGRGITVCDRWKSFATFLQDMGPRPSSSHSLDRIDTNADYVPSNCRWATSTEQAWNKRDTVFVTFQGQTMPLCEWARELGIKRGTLYYRLYRAGWSVENALTTQTGVSANQYTGRGPR